MSSLDDNIIITRLFALKDKEFEYNHLVYLIAMAIDDLDQENRIAIQKMMQLVEKMHFTLPATKNLFVHFDIEVVNQEENIVKIINIEPEIKNHFYNKK